MPEQESKEDLYVQLMETVKKLGWGLAIPQIDENDDVPGLIIGSSEYLQLVTNILPKQMFLGNSCETEYHI